MDQAVVDTVVRIAYVAAAVLFVLGLHRMNSPATARSGNLVSAVGMGIAVVAAVVDIATPSGGEQVSGLAWPIIATGTVVGGGLGLFTARTV
ncbi:MAG: NAD(P)(+) transhydrogenase (Re/Si-specific) subunit beta, partial [Chloroflexota bacterium]|nr:NAD(P)(+) transhydrogenase (Re/Si-specific) subunit beta [Chloroflexota bacterium]